MTMPNFLIIGAAKSGTTALYEYIRQHPQVFASRLKEPGFFALESKTPDFHGPGDELFEPRRVRDLARYQGLFREVRNEVAIGEASNLYLYSGEAPERIRHYVPTVKLIAMLRNPADRAFSAYRFLLWEGRETLSTFEAALEAEDGRIAQNWEFLWHYTQAGFYYRQLKRYFDLFDPKQIAVYTHDDLAAGPGGMTRNIFRFLGVDAAFVPDMSTRHNVSGTPRSRRLHTFMTQPSLAKDLLKSFVPASLRRRFRDAILQRNIVPGEPKLGLETRRKLVELFREDILKLQTLLGRDLSKWLEA
jgi:Sulfotransferase domain